MFQKFVPHVPYARGLKGVEQGARLVFVTQDCAQSGRKVVERFREETDLESIRTQETAIRWDIGIGSTDVLDARPIQLVYSGKDKVQLPQASLDFACQVKIAGERRLTAEGAQIPRVELRSVTKVDRHRGSLVCLTLGIS
jgi:hypothetical protein